MPVEVQTRTIAMDFWASIEHELRYKKDLPEAVRDDLADDLRECAEQSAKLDDMMQRAQVKHHVLLPCKAYCRGMASRLHAPLGHLLRIVGFPKNFAEET